MLKFSLKLKMDLIKSSMKLVKQIGFPILGLALLSCESKEVKQIEIENAGELKKQIIQEIAKTMSPKDTLFLVNERTIGVCGNDDRYDGVTTPEERLEELKYIKENPYFINLATGFDEKYAINGKVIFVGYAFDSEFTSASQHFYNDSLKVKKKMLDLQPLKVKKDSVEIRIQNYSDREDFKQLLFVKRNSNWEKQ